MEINVVFTLLITDTKCIDVLTDLSIRRRNIRPVDYSPWRKKMRKDVCPPQNYLSEESSTAMSLLRETVSSLRNRVAHNQASMEVERNDAPMDFLSGNMPYTTDVRIGKISLV